MSGPNSPQPGRIIPIPSHTTTSFPSFHPDPPFVSPSTSSHPLAAAEEARTGKNPSLQQVQSGQISWEREDIWSPFQDRRTTPWETRQEISPWAAAATHMQVMGKQTHWPC